MVTLTGMTWMCNCGDEIQLEFTETYPSIRYRVNHTNRTKFQDILIRDFWRMSSQQFADTIMTLIFRKGRDNGYDCDYMNPIDGEVEVDVW